MQARWKGGVAWWGNFEVTFGIKPDRKVDTVQSDLASTKSTLEATADKVDKATTLIQDATGKAHLI